jgi:hypothetical protein
MRPGDPASTFDARFESASGVPTDVRVGRTHAWGGSAVVHAVFR